MIKLTVELAGTDPISGADVTIAHVAADSWQNDIIPSLINDTFSHAQAFAGTAGLEGLRRWDVHMLVGLNASGINPAFMLDASLIHRFSQCGASLDFDPYIHEMPAVDCDIDEDNDFIVKLSAVEQGHQQVDVAIRRLREYGGLDDVYIWQLFKDALKYHGDNSLQGFRDKQLMMTLYARYHETPSATGQFYESDEDYVRPGFHLNRDVFIRLNAANARFYYCPFEKRRAPV